MRKIFSTLVGSIWYLVPALLVLVVSCKEDDESDINPVEIQFSSTSIVINESAREESIIVPLGGAADANGTVEVAIAADNAVYGENFIVQPNGTSGKFIMNIARGQTTAQFKLAPLDNALMNDARVITLTLSNPSPALRLGSQTSMTITLTDDEGPTQINFANNASAFAESSEGTTIQLPLTSSAPGNGVATVAVASNGTYGTDFTTVPAANNGVITLETLVGDVAESIQIVPVNDGDVNESITVTMTIETATGGIEAGTNLTHTVTITDDETPSTAAFQNATQQGFESESTGLIIPVTFTPATNAGGTLVLDVTSTAIYGTQYTTEPAMSSGKITLTIPSGSSQSTFKVIPVNNDSENANFDVTFSMSSSSGVVVIGAGGTSTTITVADDDQISTIATVRGLHSGSDVTLPVGTNIRGVVVSSNNNLTSRNVYIQDATASMLVRFTTANTYAIGDDIKVNLSGAVLTSFNGNLQVGVANANASKLGTATLPSYQEVTINELTSNLNNYEGELVQVIGAGFPDANATLTMSGSKTASDGVNTVVVRSESYAPWSSTAMPYGLGTIRGIASEFNGAAQILPMVYADDIVLTTSDRVISVTQAVTGFGSVENGVQSASKQFTVMGTALSFDLTVTAPSGFQLSKDNTTFGSSVTFTAAEAASAQTLYVRFAPVSGTDGTITGSVVAKSLGAEAKTFSVTGVEIGNTAGATRVMNENFEYTVASALTANGWTQSGTTTTNPISVVSTGLSLTGYPASGGNGVAMMSTGQDVYKSFTAQASGSVYLAFLVNLSAVQATGDYFIGLSPSTLQTNYFTRLHAKTSGAGYQIGVKKNNETATVYGSSVFDLNTTYLVVVKYTFNAASTTDDVVNVFVFADSNVPASEPVTAEILNMSEATKTDASDLGFVSLRQGSGTAAPTLTIDGIRVAGTWEDLFN